MFIGLILLLAIGIIMIPDFTENLSNESYVYVASDSLGEWYFNYSSIEDRMDEEEGISVVDLWVKINISLESNICGRDELLWHVDILNM